MEVNLNNRRKKGGSRMLLRRCTMLVAGYSLVPVDRVFDLEGDLMRVQQSGKCLVVDARGRRTRMKSFVLGR